MNLAAPMLISLTLLTLTGSAQDQTVSVPELETLQKEYAALVKTTDGPYLAAVGELDKKYIAALEQKQKTAQQAGKLDDAMALDAEKKAISSGRGVPVGDDAKTPGVLKPMHATYRAEIAKLEPLRAKNLKPLRDEYVTELDALVLRLTKDGKLQEAMTVRKFREEFHVVLSGGALSAKRIPMQGVVMHYSFDRDGGKSVPDRSGQGNTGTVNNSKWTPNGRFGGAYEFSGPEQYIGVDDHRSMDLPAEMSVAAWVKIARTGNADVICAKGFGGGESWLLDVYGGQFRFVRRQNGGASYIHATSAQAVQPGVWTHVVGVADGERLRIYVNAVETIGQSYSGHFDTNDHKLSIGSRQSRQGDYDLHLVGTIDEVKVYNRPLSSTEIKTMYDSLD